MLTFNQTEKDQLIRNLEAHKKADEIRQGSYWQDGKGCAVGCMLVDYGVSPSDHSKYEDLFGVPMVLGRIEDRIFEGLSVEDSEEWLLRFAHAIPVEVSLELVYPKFQQFILVDPEHGVVRFAKTDEQRNIINECSALFDDFPSIDRDKARDCRKRAYADAYAADAYAADAYAAAADAAAADAAAAYAADAADAAGAAAAYAADAADAAYAAAAGAAADAAAADAAARKSHYKIMADKLIELMEAA